MATTVDFKKGLRVRIMNSTPSGEEFEEGMAVIKKIRQGDKQGVYADVEFEDETGRTFQRWVFAKNQ